MRKTITLLLVTLMVLSIFPVVAFAGNEEAMGDDTQEGKQETPAFEYSEKVIELVARVVYAEARGESFAGKVAVANVVVNRFESGLFGKTLSRVVKAKNQFAVSGRTNDDCRLAATWVMTYKIRPLPVNTYFFRVSKSKKWRSFVYYGRLGNHSFYTQGKPVMPDEFPDAPEADTTDFAIYGILQSLTEDLREQFD